MTRFILDTNVFVSGLFWGGIPFQILEAWQKQKTQLVFSAEIMQEYSRVAHTLVLNNHKFADVDISAALELVAIYGEFASPVRLKEAISRDPDDDKFIACALGAECSLIVSGDKDLLDISGYSGITVMKPSAFTNIYLK